MSKYYFDINQYIVSWISYIKIFAFAFDLYMLALRGSFLGLGGPYVAARGGTLVSISEDKLYPHYTLTPVPSILCVCFKSSHHEL